MTSRVFIGIDPGLTGAIAVIADGDLCDVIDMPTVGRGKAGRQTVNSADKTIGVTYKQLGGCMTEKLYVCNICKEYKTANCFSPTNWNIARDNLHSYCKPCRSRRVADAEKERKARLGRPKRFKALPRSIIWPRDSAESRCDLALMEMRVVTGGQFGIAAL